MKLEHNIIWFSLLLGLSGCGVAASSGAGSLELGEGECLSDGDCEASERCQLPPDEVPIGAPCRTNAECGPGMICQLHTECTDLQGCEFPDNGFCASLTEPTDGLVEVPIGVPTDEPSNDPEIPIGEAPPDDQHSEGDAGQGQGLGANPQGDRGLGVAEGEPPPGLGEAPPQRVGLCVPRQEEPRFQCFATIASDPCPAGLVCVEGFCEEPSDPIQCVATIGTDPCPVGLICVDGLCEQPSDPI